MANPQNVSQNGEVALRKSLSNSLNEILSNKATEKMIRDALGSDDARGRFVTNMIELANTDTALSKCDPKAVTMEALKAVSLGIPLSKTLGMAYVIAYGGQPQFQLGYKGLYQIARRSHTISKINVATIYKGQNIVVDYITGDIEITGEADNSNLEPIGYLAYIKEFDGFEKPIYWSLDKMVSHAITYSKTTKITHAALKEKAITQSKSGQTGGAVGWIGCFEAMAHKTILKYLLSHWATIDPFSSLGKAIEDDTPQSRDEQIAANANSEIIEEAEAEEVKVEQPQQPQDEKAPFEQ